MFKITRRHFEIIAKQAKDNFPRECGGFVGGKEGMIQAILPVYNQAITSQYNTFALSSDDLLRAHEFFKKHGMEYYGFYHSHPNGAPHPSKQDIMSGQRFHFIVSMKDSNSPMLTVFSIKKNEAFQVPIELVENSAFEVADLFTGKSKKTHKKGDIEIEAEKLQRLITGIAKNKPRYKKRRPKCGEQSSFSTSA